MYDSLWSHSTFSLATFCAIHDQGNVQLFQTIQQLKFAKYKDRNDVESQPQKTHMLIWVLARCAQKIGIVIQKKVELLYITSLSVSACHTINMCFLSPIFSLWLLTQTTKTWRRKDQTSESITDVGSTFIMRCPLPH